LLSVLILFKAESCMASVAGIGLVLFKNHIPYKGGGEQPSFGI